MLTVLSFKEASLLWRDFGAVVSIEDISTSNRLRLPDEKGVPQHLVLQFDDVDRHVPGTTPPSAEHIGEALAFARAHADVKLLVHCQAGQCRSGAVALAIIADRLGPGLEADAVRKLLEIRPQAAPNLIALAHADALLARAGKLEAAWLAHEASDDRIARLRLLKNLAYAQSDPAEFKSEI